MDTQWEVLQKLKASGELTSFYPIQDQAVTGTNSFFEIRWTSGDITWLPYYQVTHLQVLSEYLDLMGVQKISKLPKGSGTPPQDDPQILFGAISKRITAPNPPVFKNRHHYPTKKHLPSSKPPSLLLTSTRVHTRPKLDLSYIMPATHHPSL